MASADGDREGSRDRFSSVDFESEVNKDETAVSRP